MRATPPVQSPPLPKREKGHSPPRGGEGRSEARRPACGRSYESDAARGGSAAEDEGARGGAGGRAPVNAIAGTAEAHRCRRGAAAIN